jgi:hypothetical protein
MVAALTAPTRPGPLRSERLGATVRLLDTALARTRARAIWTGRPGALDVVVDEQTRLSERLRISIAPIGEEKTGAPEENWPLPGGICVQRVAILGRPDTVAESIWNEDIVELQANSTGVRLATFRADGTFSASGAAYLRVTDCASGHQRYFVIAPDGVGTFVKSIE